MNQEIFGFDAFSPKEVAGRVENVGVTKARLPLLSSALPFREAFFRGVLCHCRRGARGEQA